MAKDVLLDVLMDGVDPRSVDPRKRTRDEKTGAHEKTIADVYAIVQQLSVRLSDVPDRLGAIEGKMDHLSARVDGLHGRVDAHDKQIKAIKEAQVALQRSLEQVTAMQKVPHGTPSAAYDMIRKRRQRFYNVPVATAPHRSGKVPMAQAVGEARSWLVGIFTEAGVKGLDGQVFQDIQIFKYGAARHNKEGQQMVVATLSDLEWVYQLGAVSKAVYEKHGVSWGVELNREEVMARRKIQEHPAFQRACGRAPAGVKPNWRYDQCVIGKWGPQATVWTLDYLQELEKKAAAAANAVEVCDGQGQS